MIYTILHSNIKNRDINFQSTRRQTAMLFQANLT